MLLQIQRRVDAYKIDGWINEKHKIVIEGSVHRGKDQKVNALGERGRGEGCGEMCCQVT